MEEEFYPKLNWEDYGTLEEKVQAIYNVLNGVSYNMSAGRVPQILQSVSNVRSELINPLSIAFVKIAEKGELDETTMKENASMFLSWAENVSYNMGDLRTYEVEVAEGEIATRELKLYQCLQAHTSQTDWTPNTSTSLWKEVGVSNNGVLEWSQPISAGDAYNTGDEVMYNGTHYRSLIDNNVWSPEAYTAGWEEIKNG